MEETLHSLAHLPPLQLLTGSHYPSDCIGGFLTVSLICWAFTEVPLYLFELVVLKDIEWSSICMCIHTVYIVLIVRTRHIDTHFTF